MYRVLHISPFFPPDVGGIANSVSNLCQTLGEMGVKISILCPRKFNATQSVEIRNPFLVTRIRCIYLPGWPFPTLRSVSIPLDLGVSMRFILKEGRFDLVHIHGHHYPISWIGTLIASNLKIPTVLSLHGMYALNPKVLGGKTIYEEFFNRVVFSKLLSKTTAI